MDKTRTLPPLVRGKVTGVLYFFVDEIRLFRDILFLTDDFDVVLQVQWWGEILPNFIRPHQLNIGRKKSIKCHLIESFYHCAQYEIKTTLDLFKVYLKNCEVLELSVLEAFENYVIGSAFLKDLINVLCSSSEFIRIPIFDYLGEVIGEVIIHFNLVQKHHQDKVIIHKSSSMLKNNKTHNIPDKQECDITSKMKSNPCNLAEKIIFYDSVSNVGSTQAVLPLNSFNFKEKENTRNSKLHLTVGDTNKNLFSSHAGVITNKLIEKGKESIGSSLPEIQNLNDASKVLYFGVTSERTKHKTHMKKPKISNKFNSNSIKYKSEHTEPLGRLPSEKINRKSVAKNLEGSKNLAKPLKKTRKEREFKASETSTKLVKSEIHPLHKSRDLRNNIPQKQTLDIKVLEYLLGSDMSKDEEESALNDFKKMSPSHNLVDSVSQLCLDSDKDLQKSTNRYATNPSASLKQNLLNFDFNNTVERNYYAKFFLKSNSPPDFEIAELLNQPENNFVPGKSDGSTQVKNKPLSSSMNSISQSSFDKNDVRNRSEDYLINVSLPDRRNSCARCKYYKKLNELDTIIESLKHFEQKMLSHEKDLQSGFIENSDMLIKRDHF